ncbi:lysophospholipid acyltransferase family protein [Arcobacter sp.]|uniref:lysophospholipid acyltransferase family protein n=2 Tax=Arcobacter sp. TaxID=1872629 RepID=UPI003D153239
MILSKIRGYMVLIQFTITVAIVVVAMYLFKNHVHKIIKTWMKLQIFFLGIKIEEVGKMDESCEMVIMNHQSLLDIIVIEHIHNKHLAWVGKREITDLFFFGHIMKAPQMITIDRENKTGLVKLIKEAKDRLSKKRPIAIFPEGTRSEGNDMLSFKPGAAMVANKLNLRVQPLIILNTKKILDSQKLEATPGVVKVIYLEPIQANKDTNWYEETEAKMREVLAKETRKGL